MNKNFLFFLAAVCWFAGSATAQDTNSLRTKLGVFEARTNVVLVKGYGQVGSIAAGPVELSVRCKETTDIGSGQKVYGVVVELTANPLPRERILIDDDEVDSLLDAINYIIKSNYEVTDNKVTALPGFDASYTTKAGLQVLAHSLRRDGGLELYIQYGDDPRISLSSMQMTQFYGLMEQARKNLDALKSSK